MNVSFRIEGEKGSEIVARLLIDGREVGRRVFSAGPRAYTEAYDFAEEWRTELMVSDEEREERELEREYREQMDREWEEEQRQREWQKAEEQRRQRDWEADQARQLEERLAAMTPNEREEWEERRTTFFADLAARTERRNRAE